MRIGLKRFQSSLLRTSDVLYRVAWSRTTQNSYNNSCEAAKSAFLGAMAVMHQTNTWYISRASLVLTRHSDPTQHRMAVWGVGWVLFDPRRGQLFTKGRDNRQVERLKSCTCPHVKKKRNNFTISIIIILLFLSSSQLIRGRPGHHSPTCLYHTRIAFM